MSISKKFVIIDEVMDQLEAAKSGVVPGSVSQSVVSGIQNVPASIVQSTISGASASAYTTFPLSPIVKNCCMDKTYLNFEYDINYALMVTLESAVSDGDVIAIPYWFGLRDTASQFNQIQVLIENTAIWSTVYQREESVVAYNALPETEIRGNNQYASIEKMKEAKYSPMKRVIATFEYDDFDDATHKIGVKNMHMHMKCTVDMNRLTPLLSNLHYTTPHMGNLRLKVFFQEFAKCLFFCPDYGYKAFRNTKIMPEGSYPDANEVEAAINAAMFQPDMNQYWSFYPFNVYAGNPIMYSEIPFYCLYTDADDVTKMRLVQSVTFNNPIAENAKRPDFMTFANGGIAEIVQTNFEIKPEEYERLTNYFASTGSVIIPTQTWSTSVFNNSALDASNTQWNASMVGNVGGYNINFISVFFHPTAQSTYFSNEYLQNFQLILDGRPVNAIPYEYMNDKCIVDMTQAIIDTDHEEINHSFMDSLTFLNMTDTKDYLSMDANTIFGSGGVTSSIDIHALRNPGTCMYNFSTNLPDAFHSGACILENSNRQAVIRFISSNAKTNNAAFTTNRNKFPVYLNSQNTTTTCGFTCFCDACIVLNFDASRNTCFDGQLSWASPYID